jgi:hypothetical protein
MANKSHLSATEVCLIIRACSESQVTQLKLGDLEISLGHKAPEPVLTAPTPDTAISEIQTQIEKEELVEQEIRLRDDQIKQMLIEDPYEAEKLMIKGELESDGSDEDPEET